MKYLFIAGCARSGTTALAHLVGSHSKVVMGIERYGHLIMPNTFSLSPEHFTKERFYNLQPEDTFYSDFDKFHQWDPMIRDKFDGAMYIGDKRPEFYEVYDDVFAAFSEATVLFIYRDIYDVAASWNKRAQDNENWPVHKDFKKAIYSWDNSLKKTLAAIGKKQNVIPIKYEEVFLDAKPIGPLYEKLGLDVDASTAAKYKNIILNSARLAEERKKFRLSEDQREFVRTAASFRFLHQIDELRLHL